MHPLLKFVEQVLYVIIIYTTLTRLAWIVHLDLLTDSKTWLPKVKVFGAGAI